MASSQSKTLIIAEKPSVANDIARALGGMKRMKDFFESDSYLVSSAVGHLLEMSAPDGVEVKRGKWNLSNLPVLPEHNHFKLSPIKASESRLQTLQKLYKRADVSEVINACDAGREGELIFYNLMEYFRRDKKDKKDTKGKPVRRLWLNSMTPTAIRAGFGKLRDNHEMVPLQQAAVCRAEADWLVGINSTRAITALHSNSGGFMLTTVGRVQTPTLAILVDREQQIKAFVARDYWEVRAIFAAAAGQYEGRWVDTAIEANRKSDKNDKNDKNDKAEDKYPDRIFEQSQARQIVADCVGGVGEATEKKKPTSEIAPPLFDLTSLQREANARFGLSARATLGAAQALYERHKIITYPRTDSKALPEDYPAVVGKTMSALAADDEFGIYAKNILQQKWINPANKRIFNNSKVSDHFAIVPTGEPIKSALKDIESKIYRLILMRFLGVFYPPAKYENTERRTIVAKHTFLTKGRILISAGWREIGGRVPKDAEIAPIVVGEKITVDEVADEQKRTQPPPRYNEATLLSAMEGAGKFVEDEELREAMRERGMGTPATRASIIEGLVKERYVLRDGRDLLPTPKAQSLMRLLRALKVEDLTLPAMTGDWEYKLRRIEQADFDHTTFIGEIFDLTKRIVSAAQKCGEVESVDGDYAILTTKCLACGEGEVRESHRRFSCQACDFFIWKAVAGREFSIAEVEILLKGEKTAELEGFRSKMGREFSAEMVLRKDEAGIWRTIFDFGADASSLSNEEIRQKDAVGNCPKCGATVRDIGNAFVCENKNSGCDFGMARRLLQREMKAEEINALLSLGKTDFLDGFISKKTHRPFTASLTMDLTVKEGKLGFEFKPRTGAKKSIFKKPIAAKVASKSAAPKSAAAKKPAKKAAKKAVKKAAKKPAKKSSD